ncbi:ABC transporter ATP-binding protein [Streptomyces sp. NPDC051104]|uniref:ABC transporter ATP-binding protein n=1 Tax=Streptomyces sp. NPDC051104 TaxID=3155044 RepID=UPI0034226352
MTRTAPMLSAREITVGYDDETVLEGVDLALDAGRCLAVVGANGCGKSTLLRVLVGRQEPDRGEVEFLGAPPRETTAGFRREVAVLLDGAECFPDLTVLEHVRMVAVAHGLGRRADGACEAVLDAIGLGRRVHAFPDALSAGQRQMLLLAAALVRPARLIVADEPEQRLDSRSRGRLASALRTAKEDGTAVLLACHDPELVDALADDMLVLDAGKAAAYGAADEVRNHRAVPWG